MSEQKKTSRQKFIILGIAIAIIILLIALVKNSRNDGGGGTNADPILGSPTASVVIKEYSDFQCPACKAAVPVVKGILKEYGDKVRLEYNDFPLPQHEYSSVAAIGAQCAFDQGKFAEYHDKLFDNQTTWAGAADAGAAQKLFEQYAQEIGLDMNAFAACTTSDAIAKRIDEDKAEARGLGVNQTPTFFVNNKPVTGNSLPSTLRTAIDAAIGK